MTAATKTASLQCLECRVPTPAEVIIWGKLAGAQSLGPRCMQHAEARLGSHFAGRISQWAVVDLRASPVERTTCRQCRDELPYGTPVLPEAAVVIWDPTLPIDALGPKCTPHAVEHLGHDRLAAKDVGHGVYDMRTAAEKRQARQAISPAHRALLRDLEQVLVEHAEWGHPLEHGDLDRASGVVPVSLLLEFLREHGGARTTPGAGRQ